MSEDKPKVDFGLEGKTAIILGVSPGMGLECARYLALAGANIACVDIDGEIARSAAAVINTLGVKTMALGANVLDRKSVQTAYDAVREALGEIDVLVNVVGISRVAPFVALTDLQWTDQIGINLTHHFITTQEAVLRMRARGGTIVMLGSVAGTGSSPEMVPYGVAKAGVSALARSIAMEHAVDGIRCNVVAPGAILTPRMRRAFGSGDRLAAFSAAIPMGRPGEPSEIAKTVLFLASDLSSYVTGQTIICDGGVVTKFPLPNL